MSSFNEFNLQPATREALAIMEITEPTPIQAEAIPALLAGNDLVGQSATGSGKTLAYGVPLVERLARDKRIVQALVLLPTRELAVQVHAVLGTLATGRRLTTALLVGGRPYASQISALRHGSQIVIGTPGRVKDLLDRGNLVLSELRMCILDEADLMLDIGFAPVIEEILTTTPETRQTALFSATIPDWITKLEKNFLKNPVKVDAMGAQSTIEQIAYQVPQEQKMAALCNLLQSAEGESSLIFGRTKYGVEKLGKQLSKFGFTVGTLHGNKSQRAREEVLTAFRRGHVKTLLATNVAARGLDIHGIYQVINYELPESSDLFTHRIGRTGRMGRQGKAITLLVPSDIPKWRIMARSLGQKVALQRLNIDEEITSTKPIAEPETLIRHELEQNGEQRPKRDRKHFTTDQKHSGQAGLKENNQIASSMKRRQKDSVNSRATECTPAPKSKDFALPERSFSPKEKYGRRGAGGQSTYGRTTGKRKVPVFTASEPRYRTTRRKRRVTSNG
jgi:ATP-dependent RNA helicase DeaD